MNPALFPAPTCGGRVFVALYDQTDTVCSQTLNDKVKPGPVAAGIQLSSPMYTHGNIDQFSRDLNAKLTSNFNFNN